MAYTQFVNTTPVSTQSGPNAITSTRENLLAMRDMVLLGTAPGWAMAATGGTAEQPTTITYSKNTERVKCALTWGSSGGSSGNVTISVCSYSSNSGSTWDTIGTLSITYDSNGYVTSTSWS
jgi:hypothetical protein